MADDQKRAAYNLDNALMVVRERLVSIDIREQCRRAGAEYRRLDAGASVTIRYLNQDYTVTLPEAEVAPASGAPDLPLREKVLILHYLAQARGTAAAGRLITYRDLPGGIVYFPTFSKRTTDPLTARFGRDAVALTAAGQRMGGHPGEIGDISLVIDIFPRVPVTLVLWEGDEEFAPRLNLLFDANITDYLEPEDVTVLCETLTWRLIRSSRGT